jgi:hypothetical protein
MYAPLTRMISTLVLVIFKPVNPTVVSIITRAMGSL